MSQDITLLERAVAQTVRGLALEILDLDLRRPMAWERLEDLLTEQRSAVGRVIEAQDRARFDARMAKFDSALDRMQASACSCVTHSQFMRILGPVTPRQKAV